MLDVPHPTVWELPQFVNEEDEVGNDGVGIDNGGGVGVERLTAEGTGGDWLPHEDDDEEEDVRLVFDEVEDVPKFDQSIFSIGVKVNIPPIYICPHSSHFVIICKKLFNFFFYKSVVLRHQKY